MSAINHTRRIIFVSRQLGPEALRSAQAIRKLEGVSLFGIGETASDMKARETFDDFIRVDDSHNADRLIDAARRLRDEHGPLEQLVTAQETLLEPVALANEDLGLKGMSLATVRRVLDKSTLKATLERVGVNTPRAEVLVNRDNATEFVGAVGFPIILKPLSGSGGLASWCIRDSAQLDLALGLMQPSAKNAVLAEEYVVGEEVCIDTITIDNEPRLYSICLYRPSILEALENPRVQWRCVMPRHLTDDRYRNLIADGLKAVRALQVGNAVTHMEGFSLGNGAYTFTDATLRPAGARIGPMLGCAYDMDMHLAWARAAIDGCFDGPWERKFAVGTIFLRGAGSGRLQEVEGIDTVKSELASLITASRWPQVGATSSATYTGDGFVTVRHSETAVVDEALNFIAGTVHITYSNPEERQPGAGVTEQWQARLQHFDKQLNKPPWEYEQDELLPSVSEA